MISCCENTIFKDRHCVQKLFFCDVSLLAGFESIVKRKNVWITYFYSTVSPKVNSWKNALLVSWLLFFNYMTLQCCVWNHISVHDVLTLNFFYLMLTIQVPFYNKIIAIWLENKKHQAFEYCCTGRDQKPEWDPDWVNVNPN